MPKRPPHRSIAEALAQKAATYELQPIAVCGICGHKLFTQGGAREHQAAHDAGTLPYGATTKYYVTMAHLPAFLAESKAEIWKCAAPRADGI